MVALKLRTGGSIEAGIIRYNGKTQYTSLKMSVSTGDRIVFCNFTVVSTGDTAIQVISKASVGVTSNASMNNLSMEAACWGLFVPNPLNQTKRTVITVHTPLPSTMSLHSPKSKSIHIAGRMPTEPTQAAARSPHKSTK